MTGRFISIEGGEGAGKSTQARALAAMLEARGVGCLVTREPGGSAGAEEVRALLMHGAVTRWGARAEALLFAAARADHVETVIRPALAEGRWVISDRFIDSTRAYQGAAGGLGDAAVMALHGFGSGGLLPDRTLVLLCEAELGRSRAAARDGDGADRFALRDKQFHGEVEAAFRRFADEDPGRVRLIDAGGSVEQVGTSVATALADLLP